MVVFGQAGGIGTRLVLLAKLVVLGHDWLYLVKVVLFEQNDCI